MVNFNLSLKDGERTLSEWLAERIIEDVKVKYGIEIEISVSEAKTKDDLDSKSNNKNKDKQTNEKVVSSNNDDPLELLTPKDVQAILGIGRRTTYELLANPPFPVVRVNTLFKIQKSSFIKWLENGGNVEESIKKYR